MALPRNIYNPFYSVSEYVQYSQDRLMSRTIEENPSLKKNILFESSWACWNMWKDDSFCLYPVANDELILGFSGYTYIIRFVEVIESSVAPATSHGLIYYNPNRYFLIAEPVFKVEKLRSFEIRLFDSSELEDRLCYLIEAVIANHKGIVNNYV